MLLNDGDLVAKIEIGVLVLGLGEPFGNKLGINRLPDLLVENLVRVLGSCDADPLVGLVL